MAAQAFVESKFKPNARFRGWARAADADYAEHGTRLPHTSVSQLGNLKQA